MRTTRERSDTVARDQARLARDVLRDAAKPFQARCLEADRLLTKVLDAPPKELCSYYGLARTDEINSLSWLFLRSGTGRIELCGGL